MNKYDGYTFTAYKAVTGSSGSLGDNLVRDVIVDHAGNVWAATTTGLDKFNRNEDTFSRYTPTGKSIYVEDIFEDSQKRIWVGSNQGLYSFDSSKGTFPCLSSIPSIRSRRE